MGWWDDVTTSVEDWWDDEGKDKLKEEASDAAGDWMSDAKDTVQSWFTDDKEEAAAAQSDAAAIPGATSQTVQQNPTAQKSGGGMNWQAAGVLVGVAGLAAKFLK